MSRQQVAKHFFFCGSASSGSQRRVAQSMSPRHHAPTAFGPAAFMSKHHFAYEFVWMNVPYEQNAPAPRPLHAELLQQGGLHFCGTPEQLSFAHFGAV
jgi:hypothetical protein